MPDPAGREPAKVHKPGCHHGQHRPTGAQCRCICNCDWPLPDHPTPVGSAAEAICNQIWHPDKVAAWPQEERQRRFAILTTAMTAEFRKGLRRGAELEKERVIARVCRHCVCSLTHQNGCQCENDE